MSFTDSDISDGLGLGPGLNDIIIDPILWKFAPFRTEGRSLWLGHLLPDTVCPILPIEAVTINMRHTGAAEIPFRQRRITPGGTDWIWLALPLLQDYANSPAPRRLRPQGQQGGEAAPPALFEMDTAVIVAPTVLPAPTIAHYAWEPQYRGGRTLSETVQPWPPQTGAERCMLFAVSPDPVRAIRRLNPPPPGEVVPVLGVTFNVFLAPGQSPDGNLFRPRARPDWGTLQPLVISQAEIQDWHVQHPGPSLRSWRPKRPDPQAEGNGGYFVLLVPTLDLSWWARDELPRWTRPRRQGSQDAPTLPDNGGDLAVSWALPVQTPKRLPPGPSRQQDSFNWNSLLSFVVFGGSPNGTSPLGVNAANPFWVSAAGVYQAGAVAGKVL